MNIQKVENYQFVLDRFECLNLTELFALLRTKGYKNLKFLSFNPQSGIQILASRNLGKRVWYNLAINESIEVVSAFV